MNYRIIPSTSFLKESKRLARKYPSFKNDLEILQKELIINPNSDVEIGVGLRKVRMAIGSKGKGKSHGARVITYTVILSVDEGDQPSDNLRQSRTRKHQSQGD